MQRILIVGCPGAGKTTLARRMAKKLNLPLIHLDKLFWTDGWVPRDQRQFDSLISAELCKPSWIIDGNYLRTLPKRLESCDTVVFLDVPRRVCFWGIVERVICNYGKSRQDMGDRCPERFDTAFLKYVWNFPREPRAKLYQCLNAAPPSVTVVVLRSRKQANRFVATL